MKSTEKSSPPRARGLLQEVDASLEGARVPPGSVVLVGVSGGPDSTALLSALVCLRTRRGLAIHACIVEHGIRALEESAADVDLVRSLCHSLGVPLSVSRVPPGECARRAKEEGRSLEEVAREIRHLRLKEAACAAGADLIALGHTRDDAIETLLMRIFQGSDACGLQGMTMRSGRIVRPLLRCARSDVLSYLAGAGLAFREDQTNSDTAILRNRIRHVLIPALAGTFPGYRRGILMLSRKLTMAGDLVRDTASALPWDRTGSGFSIPRSAFLDAAPAVRAFSLLRLYDAMKSKDSPRRLPWRFISPALEDDRVKERGWILHGHGVGLRARAGRLFWGPDIVRGVKKGYFIVIRADGSHGIKGAGMRVDVFRKKGRDVVEADASAPGGIEVLARQTACPLVLRSRRKGDRILLEGGARSVSTLFNDWDVSEEERWKVPIVADRNGVLAVLGECFGHGSRARAGALAGGGETAPRIALRSHRDRTAPTVRKQERDR